MPWIYFVICLVTVWLAGVQLSRYGDIIAEKTGLGRNWVGLVLLATVTSLPELVTGLSSVTVANVPNIAVGNVLGACVFNLFVMVIIDFLHRGESCYTKASQGHVLSATFGVVILGLIGFSILTASHAQSFVLGHIGLYTPLILSIYLIAMRLAYLYEQEQMARFVEAGADSHVQISLGSAAFRFGGAAILVLAAGVWLPFIGDAIAEQMGWQQSFVGTVLITFATSAPELAVTVAAVRMGALDMAIANLLGSNLFNMNIIALDDLFFVHGALLSQVSPVHAVSAFSAIVMSGIAVLGLYYRPKTRLLHGIGWVSLALLTMYLLNTYVLFLYG